MSRKKNINKNIAIITWLYSINYGTCLQSLALFKFLSDKKYNVYFPERLSYYYGIKNPLESILFLINLCRKKIFKNPNSLNNINDLNKDIQLKYKQREEKNKKFVLNNTNLYSIDSKNMYKEMLENTDIFITGSDQIWNPNYVLPIYLLAFAQKKHKKYSYASSVGVTHIPFWKRNMYKKYLSRLDKISVRENTSKKTLQAFIKKDINVVLDPTFLLKKQEWLSIINTTEHKDLPKNKYIFCYFIGKDKKWENDIQQYAQIHGYDIYCALSESYNIPSIGIIKPELGANEFVNYLMHAELIATDSFHASALSINFNKNFIVYKRFKDDDKRSENSRVLNLLETYQLQNRLITNSADLKNFEININYININHILHKLREESEQFLINAIEGEE